MITSNNDNIGIECEQTRHERIHFFDYAHLARKIPRLAACIRFLDVHVEVIKIVPIGFKSGEFMGNGIAGHIQHFHPRQPRDTAIHPIDGDRRRIQAVQLGIGWNVWKFGKPAQGDHIGGMLVRQQTSRLLDELIRKVCRRFGFPVQRTDRESRRADLERIGLCECVPQTRCAHHKCKAMFLDRSNKKFDAIYFDATQYLCQLAPDIGRDATCAPIGDDAVFIHRTKVTARGHIIGTQLKIHAQRFEGTAPDLVFDRVVPKDGKMPRSTANRDSRSGGLRQPEN